MVTTDFYATIGAAVELLAASPYHRQYALGHYLETEILPPLGVGQTRLYLTEEGVPTGFVTWAWLTQEVEADILATGRGLRDGEWDAGDRLFFNDWITPYGNTREVVHDMTHNVFPQEIAMSVRRNQDGTIKRINRWIGAGIAKDAGTERAA